jgi:glyceraldehyde 3-phosphate dehydrogenase
VDLTVRTKEETTYNKIAQAMEDASRTYLRGVLGFTKDPVVSTDFLHDPLSSIFDYDAGMSIHGTDHKDGEPHPHDKPAKFFKLVSWYDNEWGYSNRCVDLLRYMIDPKSFQNG